MSHAMKRRVTVLSSLIAVILGANIAFAAWTANGTGTGAAEAGSAQAVTLTSAAQQDLFPGGEADLRVTFSNPNPYPVTVTAISQRRNSDNQKLAITSGNVTCDASNGVSFDEASNLSVVVPAKSGDTNGTESHTLTNAVNMSNASVDACQGQAFSVPLAFTAASSAN